MSFLLDFKNIITSDSSLNSSVEDICWEVLPENYDITKDWLVYSFRKASQADCMGQRTAYTTYQIMVRLLSPDTVKLNDLGDYIQNYLNDKEYGGIQNIWFSSDNHSADIDKGQYSITLEFSAIYA